jgi:molecular chaperone DnaK (HSP70)
MTAIGIDLGTTNSVAAYCGSDRRNLRVLPNSMGENLTPSVVSLMRPQPGGGEAVVVVGKMALDRGRHAPEDTVLSIKRLMGSSYADPKVQEIAIRTSYAVVPGPGDDPRAHVLWNGRAHSPAEISALILKKVRADASAALGEEVTHAVITVPAYFNDAQRAATREAGERAGLVVQRIIDEPTAAAIAYGVQVASSARHRILVYDMGGGTFDISILQMVRDHEGRESFEVLEHDGDRWLGGDDFDTFILDKLVARMRQETGDERAENKRFLFKARKAAEEAKRALGQAPAVAVSVADAYRRGQGVLVDVELQALSQDEFEGHVRGLVDRSMELVHGVLSRQNLTPEDISDVLLVGGATLTPLVHRTVEGFFGAGKMRRSINPMECVALGAAVLAATQRGLQCPACRKINEEAAPQCQSCGVSLASAPAVGGVNLGEVTGQSLGVAAVKGTQKDVYVPIIPKGTRYPLREPSKRRFEAINGRRIVVPVYQGEHPVASRNIPQGVVEYNLPLAIDSNTLVEVSFNLDRNCNLTVTVTVPGKGLLKSETMSLRYDRPLPAMPAAHPEREPHETWEDELADAIEGGRRFLAHYRPYMEIGPATKLQRDIERAQQALVFPDEVEGRQMNRLLHADVFNSGVAFQLFQAERATEGAPPEELRRILDAARRVRDSYEGGDRAAAAEQARLLKLLVAKTTERRAEIQGIADREDYGSFLRLLREQERK